VIDSPGYSGVACITFTIQRKIMLIYGGSTRLVRSAGLLFLAPVLFAAAYLHAADNPKSAGATANVHAMHVLGLDGVKRGAHGTLTAQPDGLNFQASGTKGMVSIASIQDVFTGADSRQVGGKVLTLAKMGVPYGGGRVLSLFSHEKVDSLTLEFRDANGALHGAIFTMPLGQAAALKQQLVALGAHTSVPIQSQSEKEKVGGTKQ
jgi:hypothetical protein